MGEGFRRVDGSKCLRWVWVCRDGGWEWVILWLCGAIFLFKMGDPKSKNCVLFDPRPRIFIGGEEEDNCCVDLFTKWVKSEPTKARVRVVLRRHPSNARRRSLPLLPHPPMKWPHDFCNLNKDCNPPKIKMPDWKKDCNCKRKKFKDCNNRKQSFNFCRKTFKHCDSFRNQSSKNDTVHYSTARPPTSTSSTT